MNYYDIDGNEIKLNLDSIVSVDAFGAVGDGVTDDSTAIQNALNSAQGGGMVVFPKGTYLITVPLKFYSNQCLIGKGATILQGASIDNLLRTYCEPEWTAYNGVHDSVICGLTFDGGTYTKHNSLVATVHAKNIVFKDCIFKNAYGAYHNLEINSTYNAKIINCDFEGSRKSVANAELIQIDGALNSATYPWDNINCDGTISQYIDIDGCIFHDDIISPAIGNHSNAAHKFCRIHDCIFDGLTGERGAIHFGGGMLQLDIYNNTFNECTTGIGTQNVSYYIHDNRFVSATTAISGTVSVAHSNMINGTYTA